MGARADNLDGSCSQILSGKHAGKWRVQHVLTDEFGRKNRISRIFPTKTEAKEFQRSLRRGEKIETAQSKRELTLGACFDWLAEHDWPETLAESTVAAGKGRFGKYVRKEWGDVSLTRLDPLAIYQPGSCKTRSELVLLLRE